MEKSQTEKKLEIAKRKLHQGYEQAEKGEFMLQAFHFLLGWSGFLLHVREHILSTKWRSCGLIGGTAKRQRTVQVLDIPDLPKDKQAALVRGNKGNRAGSVKAGIWNRCVKPTRR
jgi:hypothetical protein